MIRNKRRHTKSSRGNITVAPLSIQRCSELLPDLATLTDLAALTATQHLQLVGATTS
jgi:hypothetical protein